MRKTLPLILVLCLTLVASSDAAQGFKLAGEPRDRTTGVPIGDLVLNWILAPGHTKYEVQMSTQPDFTARLPLKDSTVIADPTQRADAQYTVALTSGELRPDTRYYWRVIALCDAAPGCTTEVSDVRSFDTERQLRFLSPGANWTLTETVKGKAAKEPAKFGWTRSLDDDTGENDDAYTANFALQYRQKTRPLSDRQDIGFNAHLEGVLNDHNDAADTAVRVGTGITHVVAFGPGSGMANEYVLKFEGDQDFDTRKAFGEASLTFSNADLRMGYARPAAIPWLWEPTLILAYGRTIERGESTETDDTVLRLGTRVDLQFQLDPLARLLNAPTTLTISDTGYYLPNEEEDEYRNLFSAAIDVNVAAGLTVGFEFNHGAEAPEFERTHNLGITLGVKF